MLLAPRAQSLRRAADRFPQHSAGDEREDERRQGQEHERGPPVDGAADATGE